MTFGPAILLVIAGFWFAYQFVAPPPPKKIVISTGSKTGTYYEIAQQYREELAKEGIELEIISSTGSGENIRRLVNKQADLAFIQGGTGNKEPGLYSLGSLFYEPLWIILGKRINVEQIADFSGLRIAIGEEGSGTRILAKQLLELNHIEENMAQLLAFPAKEAAEALIKSEIDVDIMVASSESDIVEQLLRDNQVKLLDLNRADAYMRLLPYLSKITLPEGVIDLGKNVPAQTVTLLAPTANLVISEDFNPALIVLFLKAADVIHSKASVFSAAGTFPSSEFTAYPINKVAERFYKKGPPFLMRYLPFWPAVFIDRMIVMLVPLLALLLPLGKIMPPLYRWRIRSKIYRWYKELQEVDDTVHRQQLSVAQFVMISRELSRIEDQVNKVKTPLSYADQVYNLLLHIDLVRKKLNAKKPQS
ncbi:TAXI family TRAP transporter solute-binding subunit [Methyloprofundus sedimenti]|uniref:TAXI family TRAP transporter solute-binding subunit n=1 Tax=Methyloprofundus sedimenti TaxID=1420851 RepID=UPI001301D1C3|nr:TAXI family TRAP transporter solute-binding subunit [Methyloprofundus sedimenti]